VSYVNNALYFILFLKLLIRENNNCNHETQKLFDITYILVALQYLQIGRVVNRVRFIEEILCECMNVFIYYKTLTIHRNNIVAIIFQKTVSLPCQDRGSCHKIISILHKYNRIYLFI